MVTTIHDTADIIPLDLRADYVERELSEYARLTAADMGEDMEAAIRAMRDEPLEVARDTGLTVDAVIRWCDERR